VGSRVSARPDSVGKAEGAGSALVSLRRAVADDCRRVWLWRNEETTRGASFDSAPIAFETHRRWFDDSLQRPDRHLFIVLADGHETGDDPGLVPVGEDDEQGSSVSTSPRPPER